MDLNEHRERTNQENRFMVHNGMRLVVLEADRAVVELEVGPESLNLLGAVHGGVYFTMADCAAGAAARSGGSAYVNCDADIHVIRGAAGFVSVRTIPAADPGPRRSPLRC